MLLEILESPQIHASVNFEMVNDKPSYSVSTSFGESKVFGSREAADHYFKQLMRVQ